MTGSGTRIDPAAVLLTDATLRRALETPGEPRMLFQPIVDLRRGVTAGYEALARFSGPPAARPDQWFAAAGASGLGPELEAKALGEALRARAGLPAGTFLSVNVSPRYLATPPVARVLAAPGDLGGVVIELTEHVPYGETTQLRAELDRLRARGARIALDDTGSGYSGLQQIADLRPDVVKLDRAFVDGLDGNEVKAVFAEFLTGVASRLDAQLLAEGVERVPELDRLISMGVPLAQGWLLGRPDSAWTSLSVPTAQRVLSRAGLRDHTGTAEGLLEDAPRMASAELVDLPPPPGWQAPAELSPRVVHAVLDGRGRPVALVLVPSAADGRLEVRPVSLRTLIDTPIEELALQAVTRPEAHRFDPIVCTSDDGVYQGIVRVERLLAELADPAGRPALSSPGAAPVRVPRTRRPDPGWPDRSRRPGGA